MTTLRSDLTLPYTLDPAHPLFANVVSVQAVGAAGSSETAYQGAVAGFGTSGGDGYDLALGAVTDPTKAGWYFEDAGNVGNLPTYSIFTLFYHDDFSDLLENVLYCERPTSQQILKTTVKGDSYAFVTRATNGHFSSLINNTTYAVLDTSATIHTGLFVKNSDTNREVYGDDNYAITTESKSDIHSTAVTPMLLVDPVDAYAANGVSNILLNITFNSALTSSDYASLRADPWSIFLASAGGTSTTYNLLMQQGTQSSFGNQASLKASRKISAGASTEEGAGNQASLKASRKISAGAGKMEAFGYAATLTLVTPAPGEPTNYTFTMAAGRILGFGQTAKIVAARSLKAEAGNTTEVGSSASIKATRKITPGTASSIAHGNSAALRAARSIKAGAASNTSTGQDVKLAASRKFGINTGKSLAFGLPLLMKYSGYIEARIDGYKLSYAGNDYSIGYEAEEYSIAYK